MWVRRHEETRGNTGRVYLFSAGRLWLFSSVLPSGGRSGCNEAEDSVLQSWLCLRAPPDTFCFHSSRCSCEQKQLSVSESPVKRCVGSCWMFQRFTTKWFSRCCRHRPHRPRCRSLLRPARRSDCFLLLWCETSSWFWTLRGNSFYQSGRSLFMCCEISQHLLTGLAQNLLEIFMFLRGWILITLVILWLFLQHEVDSSAEISLQLLAGLLLKLLSRIHVPRRKNCNNFNPLTLHPALSWKFKLKYLELQLTIISIIS